MTDFEERVTRGLRTAGERFDVHTDLAAGARARLRRRRAGWTTSILAAAAVAAVPIGLAVTDPTPLSPSSPDHSDSAEPVATDSAGPEPDADWRTESWRDVTLRVPEDWGYGNLGTWCTSGGTPGPPVVDRPGGVVPAIACVSPSSGYGVVFGDASAVRYSQPSGDVWQYQAEKVDVAFYPDDAWLSIWYDDDVSVTVVTSSKALTERIAASIERFHELDGNGCPATADLSVERRGESALREPGPATQVSVCRYDVDEGPDLQELLAQSEKLVGVEAQAALEALRDAPLDDTHEVSCPKVVEAEAVRLDFNGRHVWVNWGQDCRPVGILDGGTVRELTEDAMYWALSPGWSGAVSGDVPLPDRLRR